MLYVSVIVAFNTKLLQKNCADPKDRGCMCVAGKPRGGIGGAQDLFFHGSLPGVVGGKVISMTT